jgi:hypothetical protein
MASDRLEFRARDLKERKRTVRETPEHAGQCSSREASRKQASLAAVGYEIIPFANHTIPFSLRSIERARRMSSTRQTWAVSDNWLAIAIVDRARHGAAQSIAPFRPSHGASFNRISSMRSSNCGRAISKCSEVLLHTASVSRSDADIRRLSRLLRPEGYAAIRPRGPPHE